MQAIIFEQSGRAEEVLAVRDMPLPALKEEKNLTQLAAMRNRRA